MLLETHIPVTYIFKKVKTEIVITLFVALTVYLCTYWFSGYIPEMPLTIPAFIGTALSILLSFKLSQSYDRWWEARKVWGSIVNDSRSLVVQLQSLLPAGMDEHITRIAHRQIAWCYVLGNQLRGLDPMNHPDTLLSPAERDYISKHNNKALALLQLHAADFAEMKKEHKIDTFVQLQFDNTLTRLCDSMGRAERIKTTVFPVTYRKFLHFIIHLFIVTLAIALGNISWYFEIPLLLVISSAFFLLEKSATHMQDPFSNKPTDTATKAIARTIEINIRQLLKETTIPAPHPPDQFYLM